MKKTHVFLRAMTAFTVLIVMTVILWAADPWKGKKYTEWSDIEAHQVLEHSPWANVVSIVTGGRMDAPSDSAAGGSGGVRGAPQVSDDTNTSDFTVAWYSSVPVRDAHARLASMRGKIPEEQLKQFLEPVADVCLITVTSRYQKPLMDANKETLLKKTYLQVKGKDKVYANDYSAPSAQSRLAIFQFPRSVNGTPILTEEDKDVEFVADLGQFKVRSHFTPKKMIFDGKFTY
jgi:hypothetical protein